MLTKDGYTMYEYPNPHTKGRERVYRKGKKYFVNSDWGNGFGGMVSVSKRAMKIFLQFTNAPAHVVKAILE